MNNLKFKILNSYTVILIVFLLVSCILYPILSSDSGFYLAIGREFYSGKIYFIDISSIYNPLAIIVLGFPNYIFHDFDSRIPLFINFVFMIGSGFVLYKTLCRISNHKYLITFFSLFFVAASMSLDGNQVLLEPISVFFLLLGFYHYLIFSIENRWYNIFLTGFFIALSFLSKQYGILLIFPIGLNILMNKKYVAKKIFFLALGLVIPILFLFIYLNHYGASLVDSFKFITAKYIKLDRGNGTGSNLNLFDHIVFYGVFVLYNLYVLYIPAMLYKTKFKGKFLYLFLISLATMCLVLINASYLHYFQYILPFLIILIVFLINQFDYYNKAIVILASVSLLIMSFTSLYSLLKKPKKMLTQNKIQNELNQILPPKSKVYLDGISPAFYYLCDFESVNLKKIGFCFPGYFFPKTILNTMPKGSYLIVTKSFFANYQKIVDSSHVKTVYINHELCYLIQK